MNWYKRATRSIQLPPVAYDHISRIADLIVDFYYKNDKLPENPIKIYTMRFPNPFYSLVVFADVYLIGDFFSRTIAPAARKSNGDIVIRFNKSWLRRKDKSLSGVIKRFYYSAVLHETAHASDPKIVFLDKEYKHLEYENKPTEFDAFSKQITEYFKHLWKNKDMREYIIGFLKDGDIDIIPDRSIKNIFMIVYEYLKRWKESNPKFFRTIRQRIYNEVINENLA